MIKFTTKDSLLDILIILILIAKVGWIVTIITYLTDEIYNGGREKRKLSDIQDMTRDLSILLLSIMLIYLFNPFTHSKVCIDGRPKDYLYLFGILICFGTLEKYFRKYLQNSKV
jgi:hypothetical protein